MKFLFFSWIAGYKIHPGFVPFISIFNRLQFFFLGSVKLRMRFGVFIPNLEASSAMFIFVS